MDYVVGSVAALISGNVTPNRPKTLKRALTPMKHQPSPNVTPKSESVIDRSIFLSPTMQKKKAIVKKSPKRIFQNDIEMTNENEGNSSITSPVADKVKKHLRDELEANTNVSPKILGPKSPKNKPSKLVESSSPKKNLNSPTEDDAVEDIQVNNENTPRKKKKKLSLVSEGVHNSNLSPQHSISLNNEAVTENITTKRKKKSNVFIVETIESTETLSIEGKSQETNTESIKKQKKNSKKKKVKSTDDQLKSSEVDTNVNKENEGTRQKKKNKRNQILKDEELVSKNESKDTIVSENLNVSEQINPNAITNKDTDSEHESDDEIESENEASNKAVLDTGPGESSDDEDEEEQKADKGKKVEKDVKDHVQTEEEVKRTLFVGNVPFSSKCKKEIKKIFGKYGQIETVRIRTVPVKDARVTPKLAVIKNELHPDRTTVNVYIKYANASSVNDALVENNTVLNEHHLRVARSDVTGSEHDPRCSVFVGNLPFALEDDALRARFDKCGEIQSVRIVRDRKTNAGKGFGYVNFTSKDSVELALALTEEDLTIKNRILRVKRCTQPTASKPVRQQNQQQGRQQNYHGRQQYNQGRLQHNQGRQHNNQGRQYNNQGGHYNNQGGRFNNQRGMGDRGGFQMNRSSNKFGNDRFQKNDQSTDSKGEGAYRRLMNKRKPTESSDGPPQKRQRDMNQPNKEKKTRKEFVGMTAEKKKFQKRKLNKDQKKKKALSEILSK